MERVTRVSIKESIVPSNELLLDDGARQLTGIRIFRGKETET